MKRGSGRIAGVVLALALTAGMCPAAAFAGQGAAGGDLAAADISVQTTKTSLSGADVRLEYTSCTFDGSRKEPDASVTLDGEELVEASDYRLSYSNNRRAGIATVTVRGRGDYTGTVEAQFTIKRADIAKAGPKLGSYYATYNKREKKPSVSFSNLHGLKSSSYEVEYKKNVNAGTAKAIVRGIGNYTGSKTLTFKIKKADNPMRFLTNTLRVAESKLAKKKVAKGRGTAFDIRTHEGKVTFKKTWGPSKIKVSKKGTVTIAKGTKKGFYRVEVKAKAAGNGNYKAKAITKLLRVHVL